MSTTSLRIERLARATSVNELLRPIAAHLCAPTITELCVNRPGSLFIEDSKGWEHIDDAGLTYEWAKSLAVAIAAYAGKALSPDDPFLAATLPNGERVQVVIPPACEVQTVSLTLRMPSRFDLPLSRYESDGLFHAVRVAAKSPQEIDLPLVELLASGRIREFLEACVTARKNIAIVGDTGSGKTTLMKAMCAQIDTRERLVTIEDTSELMLRQPNCVRLFFNDALGISAAMCLKHSLRMRPDRILLGELRGAETLDFLNALMSGHAGSLTSFHAESCAIAHDRMALMAKSHTSAGGYSDSQLKALARMTLDVIVHCVRTGEGRRVAEIRFDPEAKARAMGTQA